MPEAEPIAQQNAISARPPGKRGNLFDRVLSAAILAPIAIATAYVGGWPFLLFWAAAAGGIVWEWFSLVGARSYRAALAASGASLLVGFGIGYCGRWDIGFGIVLLGAVVAALLGPADRRGWVATGTLYAAAVLFAPILLRTDSEFGFHAILFLFLVVWGTDIFAYFVGRAVGGPKLAPRISPNKTWSGAIGGALVAVAIAGMLGSFLRPSAPVWLALMAFVLSAITQAGDLFESWLKRRFGAKNSSDLIPGHGGLMDRLDGFIASALAAALIGIVRGGLDAPARGLMLW